MQFHNRLPVESQDFTNYSVQKPVQENKSNFDAKILCNKHSTVTRYLVKLFTIKTSA